MLQIGATCKHFESLGYIPVGWEVHDHCHKSTLMVVNTHATLGLLWDTLLISTLTKLAPVLHNTNVMCPCAFQYPSQGGLVCLHIISVVSSQADCRTDQATVYHASAAVV